MIFETKKKMPSPPRMWYSGMRRKTRGQYPEACADLDGDMIQCSTLDHPRPVRGIAAWVQSVW